MYGASKVAAEALVTAYTNLGLVKGLSLRLVANVGTGATHGLLKDVIRKVCEKGPIQLLGDSPGSCKPFVHVGDTVEAAIHLAKVGICGPANISNDNSITVLDVLTLVLQAMGVNKTYTFLGKDANFKGDNPLVRVESKLAHWMGWYPKYDTSQLAVMQAVKDIMGAS